MVKGQIYKFSITESTASTHLISYPNGLKSQAVQISKPLPNEQMSHGQSSVHVHIQNNYLFCIPLGIRLLHKPCMHNAEKYM